jgi:hypothetical protein
LLIINCSETNENTWISFELLQRSSLISWHSHSLEQGFRSKGWIKLGNAFRMPLNSFITGTYSKFQRKDPLIATSEMQYHMFWRGWSLSPLSISSTIFI